MEVNENLAARGATRPWEPSAFPQLNSDSAARLEAWFGGQIAITRQEAHRLLEYGLASGYLLNRKEEHVGAIKALATGHAGAGEVRFRILPDG